MPAPRTFRVGTCLVAAGYAVWFLSALLGRLMSFHPQEAGAAAPYLSDWAVGLVYALTLTEILIALFPLARGERWAQFAAGVPVLVVGIPHILQDPRCLASLLTQHGCHTFLASMVLIFVGLLLTARTIIWSRIFSRDA